MYCRSTATTSSIRVTSQLALLSRVRGPLLRHLDGAKTAQLTSHTRSRASHAQNYAGKLFGFQFLSFLILLFFVMSAAMTPHHRLAQAAPPAPESTAV